MRCAEVWVKDKSGKWWRWDEGVDKGEWWKSPKQRENREEEDGDSHRRWHKKVV